MVSTSTSVLLMWSKERNGGEYIHLNHVIVALERNGGEYIHLCSVDVKQREE